jgi:methylmalonyl-CoA mutase
MESIGEKARLEVEEIAQAFASSAAELVVVCTSDARRPELLPLLAPLLRRAGAREILVAGRPLGDSKVDGLADLHLFQGCDLVSLLDTLLSRLEEGGGES